MNPIKLFAIPYAGSSANFYLKWKRALLPEVEIVPLELPGRGSKIKERPFTCLQEAIEDLLEKIERESSSQPYALFGHSMGNLLAFELMHRIRKEKLPLPICAFLSGRRPPHIFEEKKRYLMSDEDFVQELVTMGGTPQEVLENADLLQLFLPILRTDFQLVETYVPVEGREPLDVPLVIFSGINDSIANVEDMEGWNSYTTSSCQIVHYDGGHFFIFEYTDDIIKRLKQQLVLFV
ncbi:thioesterase [Brevibacillus antibioticus]|uniref:Thioesterase n=1 Tax=Brevibacillus antibioticus TaxID=2570228 RepID=A0A4U2Y3M9_9BACL|nr:alpha/beta fold hydrolase [Brevibacillus antibioticus]TKI55058.1 thioesterase [Brevibacillus antibioticus]